MQILPPTPDGLARAVAHLRSGGVVGLPTETVYGLAAKYDDPSAVAAVFAAKERPRFDPLIVHLADAAALPRVVAGPLPDGLDTLIEAAWPGPLTIVLPRRDILDLVTAGLPHVAVRVPAHPVARTVLREVGPLVAPSANRFGRISPTTATDVVRELGDRVPLVLDGGRSTVGLESTIVGFVDGRPVLLRPGGLPLDVITSHLGALTPLAPGGVIAPGQLPSHYAPHTPLVLVDDLAEIPAEAPVLLTHGSAERLPLQPGVVVVLSETGDADEAAHHLFRALRELDAVGAERIYAERWTERVGLGLAIADRLERAATR